VNANDEKIEYENDFDGNVAAASNELRVNVINEYDFPVEVYYEDSRGGILLVLNHSFSPLPFADGIGSANEWLHEYLCWT
jgi:hypothetical protein